MDALWLDIRYAVRTLLKRPGFLAVAVITLGLGAGANAAIFSVVNTILLRPLPYPNGDRIVRIIQTLPASDAPGGLPRRVAALSTDDLQEWRRQSRTLSHMAAYGSAPLTMTGREEPVRLAAARVSPALFPLLGVPALIGRTFEAGEEKAGADVVTVLSFTAWQKYFAADPDILTRKLMLDGRGYSVVGVMPRGFEFPDSQTELWVPFVLTPPARTPGPRMIQLVPVIARVDDGVRMETAQAEASVVFRQLRESQARLEAQGPDGGPDPDGPVDSGRRVVGAPREVESDRRPSTRQRGGEPGDRVVRGGPTDRDPASESPTAIRRGGPGPGGPRRGGLFQSNAMATVELSTLKEELVRPVRPALVVLLASVGFVLLIACANVANLLLTRAAGRRQEISVRAALGAGRARLLRQVLTESMVLAFMGGALGAALAWGAVHALRVLGPADIPRLAQVRIDLSFFAFALGVSVVTGLLFGIVPALRLSRMDAMHALNQGAAFSSSGLRLLGRNRTRSAVAMAEVSLAMVLLVGAGLLINSFLKLSAVNPGYDPTNVLAFQVALPEARSQTQREAFYQQMLERLRALPDVSAAAISNTLPLQQGIIRISLGIQGRPQPTQPEDVTVADVRVISPDYLTTLGLRLIDGRNLNPNAREGQPREVLVNESFVRRYLSGGRAVGARINLDDPAPWEIVGVVNDVRHAGLTADASPELYVEYHQSAAVMPRGLGNIFFTVRTARTPLPLMANVRGLVRQVDPQLVVDNMATMEQRLSASVARPRFYATLVGVFAFIAVVLAAVGIYGVLAYAVSQSTREIGIRIALGAPRLGVLRLVLSQGVAIAGAGIVVGLAGAAALTRSLTTLLFDLTPFDPATFTAVALLLAAVALIACYVPARRAMTVDPIVALRQE
jgi:predicted permease